MASKVFFAVMTAGAAFLAIGIAASVYSNVAVDVQLDNTVRPGGIDEITPEMDVGNKASLTINGSKFDIDIIDPDGSTIISRTNETNFSYELAAAKSGEYRFLIKNNGETDLSITGRTQTKASPIGFSGPLMLVITGVVVVGLGLRLARR